MELPLARDLTHSPRACSSGRTIATQGRGGLPRGLGALAIAAGVDLVLLYFATLLGMDTLVTVFGGLGAVVFGPALWVWTGSALQR